MNWNVLLISTGFIILLAIIIYSIVRLSKYNLKTTTETFTTAPSTSYVATNKIKPSNSKFTIAGYQKDVDIKKLDNKLPRPPMFAILPFFNQKEDTQLQIYNNVKLLRCDGTVLTPDTKT